MTILVTGFEPFGGETVNPAWEAVKALPREVGGARLVTLEVPTVFGGAEAAVFRAMARHRPDVVLCVGQAGGRSGLTPELVAINLDDAELTDNEGRQPVDQAIQSGGPAAYFSTLPVKTLVAALREAGLPASLSSTAGTFVCNHLLYQLLHRASTDTPAPRVGFLHVPYSTEQLAQRRLNPQATPPSDTIPSLSQSEINRGLVVVVAALVGLPAT